MPTEEGHVVPHTLRSRHTRDCLHNEPSAPPGREPCWRHSLGFDTSRAHGCLGFHMSRIAHSFVGPHRTTHAAHRNSVGKGSLCCENVPDHHARGGVDRGHGLHGRGGDDYGHYEIDALHSLRGNLSFHCAMMHMGRGIVVFHPVGTSLLAHPNPTSTLQLVAHRWLSQ